MATTRLDKTDNRAQTVVNVILFINDLKYYFNLLSHSSPQHHRTVKTPSLGGITAIIATIRRIDFSLFICALSERRSSLDNL